jgi:3-oxoadipate enol-lactonase
MPYSRSNGVDIWYEVAGDGPALVLVHANPFDHNLWMYQAAHFSTWFKVVSVDIRGYGRSAKMTTPYTLADQSNDVIGVMKDLGIARAILGGCSVGSSIALNLGLDHADLFDAIILVGGNSGPSERAPLRIENYRKDLTGYHIQHLTQLVRPEFAASRLGAYLLNSFVERQPRLVGEAIANVFLASNGTDNTGRAPQMTVPTLVINGESDNSLPAGTETATLIPGAVHKILPGTGHACCIEDPAGFDRFVIEFLSARGLMPKL